MQNHTLHIEKLNLISSIADEISYLETSRSNLKVLAQQYAGNVKSHLSNISFFPIVDSEIRSHMEKKNFTIANANEKIDTLAKLVPKLEYIKISVLGYSTLNDTELRKKTGLDNFKTQVENEIRKATIADIEGLYQKIAAKYIELNQSVKNLGDVRSKYKSLEQLLAANAGLITYFPLVQKELTDFVRAMAYNEPQVVAYLNSFAASAQQLQAIHSNILSYQAIKREDLKAIPINYHDYFKALAGIITYNQIAAGFGTSGNNLQVVNQKVNSLAALRGRLAKIKGEIATGKGSMYTPAYNAVIADCQSIETLLFNNLDTSFENCAPLLVALENKISNELTNFSEKNQNASRLLTRLNNNRTAFWVEDYNTFADKIQQYRNTPSAAYINVLENELQSLSQVKQVRINQFETDNAYLLQASQTQQVLNTNYRSVFVSRTDFELFAQSIEKNKGFKLALYRLKDFLSVLGRFLVKPQTIKIGAIIVGIILAIAFVMSFWKQILIGVFIIIIIGVFLKSK